MFNFTILLFVLRNMNKRREEENFSGIRLDSSNENVTMMLVAG